MSMPLYIIYRRGVELARVSAVSNAQAMKRANSLFPGINVEILPVGNVSQARTDREGGKGFNRLEGRTKGRRPYATPGFEDRVRALREAAGL